MSTHSIKNSIIRINLAFGIFLLTVLFGTLITSLIPQEYTSTSIITIDITQEESQNNDFNKVIKDEIQIIRSKKFMESIIKLLKLDQHPEFNIKLDTNRAISTKIIDKIYKIEENKIPLEDKIFNDINEHLHIFIKEDNKLYISYSSSIPVLSKAISTNIARKYIQTNSSNISKTIYMKANISKYPSSPNFIKAIITTIMLGLLLGIIGSIYIKPTT